MSSLIALISILAGTAAGIVGVAGRYVYRHHLSCNAWMLDPDAETFIEALLESRGICFKKISRIHLHDFEALCGFRWHWELPLPPSWDKRHNWRSYPKWDECPTCREPLGMTQLEEPHQLAGFYCEHCGYGLRLQTGRRAYLRPLLRAHSPASLAPDYRSPRPELQAANKS